jgi:glutathione S-transferase
LTNVLYVSPASHPSWAARLMLERKGIPYKRRDLINVVMKAWLRAIGFRGGTVPALKLDGRRVQGSTAIARELERVKPDPPLFPADPEARRAVEEAEAWGDEVLQSVARRIAWHCLRRNRPPVRSYVEGSRLGLPLGLVARTAAPVIVLTVLFTRATDERVRADLAALPGHLDRIDEWIADGVIGGDAPNVADFQIATSVRLLMTIDDVRPVIEGRPAGELAMRIAPDLPGHMPPTLPAKWLEPLRR